MRSNTILLILIVVLTALFVGCGNSAETNISNNGTKTANVNVSSNSNSGIETTKKPDAPTTNEAPTLKPVVVAYYDALRTKDEAALRKVLSDDLIKSLEADMKSEKKTNLAAYVAETDRIPEKGIEVRNEKINGDRGVAEVKGGSYLNWSPLAFVKEGGVWKLSNENPDVDAVTKGAK